VPPPPAHSQGAVVKLWLAKASTTGVHTAYLRQGKGLEGADAELFDRDGPVDRHAFVHRAREDGHQLRGMVSLDAGDRADLRRFLPRLMAQFEADIGSRVDWLGAIHHDTPRVHAHVVIRGVLPNGQPLYLTKSYWAHGLKYRAQGLATAMLGPVRQPMSAQLSATLGRLRERLSGKEMSR
jgi:type IV secretory pathway VirD2 relaxase